MPEDVGLPRGQRRRTPGLRREEVAQLSGVGVTWYTWLEQGRRINVSVHVIDAISRTLALDAVEREHLYRLADVPTVPSPHDEEALPPELHVILTQLHPLPAAVLSARYDVIAYNGAYEALCPGFVNDEHNVIRRVFLNPLCCNQYARQPEHLARMVGYLRSAYGKHLGDPSWTEFIASMVNDSPAFATLWARNDVSLPLARTKTIRNLITGDLEFYLTSMSLPVIAGAWVQIFTPADDLARTKLDEVLAMDPDVRRKVLVDHIAQYHGESSVA